MKPRSTPKATGAPRRITVDPTVDAHQEAPRSGAEGLKAGYKAERGEKRRCPRRPVRKGL